MATRSNSKLNASTAKVEDIHASHDTVNDLLGGFKIPTGRRLIVSFIANLLLSGTTMYLGFSLTMYLAVGAALLTGSAFLVFMVSFIGYTLAILAGIVAGGKLQAYILTGGIDASYESAKTKVSGWFGKAKAKVAGPDGAELRSKFGFSAR